MRKHFLLLFILIATLICHAEKVTFDNSSINVELLRSSHYGLSIGYSIDALEIVNLTSKNGYFTELSIDGYTYTNKVGLPKLPLLRKIIRVPLNAVIESKTTSSTTTSISLVEKGFPQKIVPRQASVSKSDDPEKIPFVTDKDFYSGNKWTDEPTAKVVELGMMRGIRLVALDFVPVQYNPATAQLEIITSATVEVVFTDADWSATQSMAEKYYSSAFEPVLAKTIFNYEPSRTSLDRYPLGMLIITPQSYVATLQSFIDWKIQQGYAVTVATTETIGSTTSAIKSYIQNIWDNATTQNPAPSYLLIAGDTPQVPAYTGAGHATDLHYVTLQGSDILPEIYYGRFSAINTTQLGIIVNKHLQYEQYTMPDPSYLSHTVLIAGYDATYGPVHGNGQINYGKDNYFGESTAPNWNPYGTYQIRNHMYLHPASGTSDAAIIQNMNSGIGYANYTAHGSEGAWADPTITASNINSMTNADKYFVAVGNCCLTNAFNTEECFGETFIRANNKGAVAYVGASDVTYWDEDYYWAVGYKPPVVGTGSPYQSNRIGAYDALFHSHSEAHADWASSLGSMIFMGNLAVTEANLADSYYWEIYSVMGDPSLIPYMGIPTQINATYADFIPMGSTSFAVSADPYTYVGLTMNNVLIASGLTNSSGFVNLSFAPINTTGMATITMTRSLRAPLTGTILVGSACLWQGTISTNWHTSGNWSGAGVPGSIDDVYISSGLTNYPVISSSDGLCNNIFIAENANLTISGRTLFVYSEYTSNGQLILNQSNSNLNVAQNIYMNYGASVNVTNNATNIMLKGSITFDIGSNVQLQNGNLYFYDTGDSYIFNKSSSTQINHLICDKTSPSFLAFSSQTTESPTIKGNIINYQNRTMYNYYSGSIILKGNLVSENTGVSGGLMWYHGTLKMDGIDQNISFANASSYINNLTASQTGSLTYTNVLLVKGNLTVENGSSITIGASHLTVEGDANFWGQLNMNYALGNLYVQGSFNWEAGSTANITDASADIYCQGNMYFDTTSNVQMTMGYIEFNGSGESAIINKNPSSKIYNLRSNKTAPGYLYISASSTAAFTIAGSIWNYQNRIFNNYYAGNTVLKGNLNNYNTNTNGFTWETGTLVLSGTNHTISLPNPNDCVNNLTLNHTGTVTTSYDLKIKGALNMISGTFSPGTYLIYVGGNWSKNTSAVFTNTNSTIIFNGNSTQTIGSTNFNILRMNKSGGNLKINTGSVVSAQSYKYDLGTIEVAGGSFIVYDLADNNIKGNYILSSGSIDLTQDNTYFVDLDANLNISGGLFSINGGFNFPADWAYTRNINITMSGGVLDWGTHSIGITNTGFAVTFNLTGGTIRTQGSISIDRPNVHFNGGTFEMHGTTDATISNVSTASFYDLKINKASSRTERDEMLRANTVTLSSNVTVDNDLNINNGTLNLSSYTLTASNNVNITGILKMNHASGVLNINNNINWNSGSSCDITAGTINAYKFWFFNEGSNPQIGAGNTVNFVGTSLSSVYLYSSTARFGSVLINKTGSSVIYPNSGAFNINGNLTINSGNTNNLTNVTTTINGSLNINGSVILSDPGTITTYDLDLAGTLTLTDATVTISHNCTQQTTGTLTINSGSFIINRAYTGNFSNFSGTTNLYNGILEVTNDGIQFGSSALLNQSGGTIKVGYYFKSIYANVYLPTQGTIEFLTARHGYLEVSNGNYLHNLIINKSGTYTVYLVTDITVNNDLNVQAGYVSTNQHQLTVCRDITINGGKLVVAQNADNIYVGRNWTNNVGSDGFTERSGTVYFNSNQAATITADTFYNVNINKPTGNLYDLTHTTGTLVINGNLNIQTGILKVNPGAILDVNGNLSLNGGGLDLISSSELTTLRIAGGLFDERDEVSDDAGINASIGCTVIFDGSNDQILGSDLPEDTITLCNATVDKSGGMVKLYDNINFMGNFRIINGEWGIGSPGKTKNFYGDLVIDAWGTFSDSTGTSNLVNATDSNLELIGVAKFGTFIINKTESNNINLTSNALFAGATAISLSAGIMNLNAYTLKYQGSLSIDTNGKLNLVSGSVLNINDNSTISVLNGGEFVSIGTISNPAMLTSDVGYYTFSTTLNSYVGAQYTIFEKMGTAGINIASRCGVDTANVFRGCTFRNGIAGGTLLKMNCQQHLNTYNAIFPANTWGGAYNVSRTYSMGSVTFRNYSGEFAGPDYDYTTNNSIFWVNPAPPDVPLNIQISIADDTATITWDAVTGATGYNIYRSFVPDVFTVDDWIGSTEFTTYEDESVIVYPKAFYMVKAYVE